MTTNDDEKLEKATSLTAGNTEEVSESSDAFVSRQVQILYRNLGVGLLATLASASFVAYFFLGLVNSQHLLLWYGATLLVSFTRFALILVYRYTTPAQKDYGWLKAFDIGSALSGAVWGSAFILIVPAGSFEHMMVLGFIVVGLSAASVATYSISRYAPSVFTLTALLPLVVQLHASNHELSTHVEVFLVLFLMGMVLFALRQYNFSKETVSIALRNQGLSKHLADNLQEKSKLNKQLSTEIKSREEAEKEALANEERFHVLSDAAFEGVMVHDNGRILDINQAVADISGYERSDLVGMNILKVIAPECHELVKSRLVNPSDEPIEISVLKKNGGRISVEVAGRDINYMGNDARVVVIRDLTNTKETEHSLMISEKRIARYMEQTLIAVIEWDTNFRVSEWNPAAEKIFGYSREEAIGSYAHDLILSEEAREAASGIWERLIEEKQPSLFTHQNITKDRQTIICEWDATPVVDNNGNIAGVVSLAHDITERVHAEEALFHEKELAEVTLSSLGDGVITTNKFGDIDYINPVAEILMGWSLDEAQNKQVGDIFVIKNEKTGESYDGLAELAMSDNTRNLSTRHTILVQRSGATVPIVFTGSPLRNYNQKVIGAVIVFRDVSELRQLENKLSYEASHDALTGLMNRREFEERLRHSIRTADEDNAVHALLYLDLDQFKVVNDTCGHIAGDELLKQLSLQLRDKVRDTDCLARLGGDEFGVLLDCCPLDMASEIAESIRDLVAEFHFSWDDKTFDTGVSIGVVPIDADSGSMTEIMSSADTACYVAKEQGRNRVHVYREDDTEVALRHGEMQWVHRIREAIEDDRVVLYVQKIQSLTASSAENDHYEVLMRMLDTESNLVPPMAFIPAAERYDMMKQLDRHVVRKAIRFIVGLSEEMGSTTEFSINLSGQSLCSHDFLDYVVDEINDTGVAADKLCFEVTETAAIGNLVHAKRFISVLRSMGCSFSLDDFGSGLSSFGYLKNLNVNFLKIDGSFVRDMANDKVDEAMVQSIHQVGAVLGMKTIAEFVEDDETVTKLKKIGVNYGQGYGIEKPKPIEDLLK